MDIMEGSKDLTELLENEVAPDVVDQTRSLVEQVVKKVRQVFFVGLVVAVVVLVGFVVLVVCRRLDDRRSGAYSYKSKETIWYDSSKVVQKRVPMVLTPCSASSRLGWSVRV